MAFQISSQMMIFVDTMSNSNEVTRDLNPMYNKSEETNLKPAGGFLIAHFKRCTNEKETIA